MSSDPYAWVKAAHIFSLIAWMAAQFYLPRLYVYHAQVQVDSAEDMRFRIMERRLLRVIMNPAMVATWVFGLLLLWMVPEWLSQGWMHTKLLAVLLLSGFHGMLSRWRRDFDSGRNTRSERFYRIANEVPTVLLLVIVIMAVVKPF